jgi:hypothetical protein
MRGFRHWLSRLHSQHGETQFRLRAQIRHLGDEAPRLEQRLEEVRRDLGTRQDTHGDLFTIQLDGQEVRDRGIAGELLLRQAERMRGSRAERQVGGFAGFSLWVADNFMAGPEIVIKGAGTHLAKVGNTALGTMRSVEYGIVPPVQHEQAARLAYRNWRTDTVPEPLMIVNGSGAVAVLKLHSSGESGLRATCCAVSDYWKIDKRQAAVGDRQSTRPLRL